MCDLELVAEIERRVCDELPFFYNYSLTGGYFTMPTARLPQGGTLAVGASSVSPYRIYGVNFAPFDRLELTASYRIFHGIMESNFGHEGFGDDADRVASFKLSLLHKEDGLGAAPELAFGLEDFIGTKRFHSLYVVATKQWKEADLELSLGWGKGRIHGLFGGVSYSPFRRLGLAFLRGCSLLAEYDANRYKRHAAEHPKGREVSCRVNVGLAYKIGDLFQFSVSTLRGKKVAGMLSAAFPLGTTDGLFPKTQDSDPCETFCDPKSDLAERLRSSFEGQGIDLYSIALFYDPAVGKELWLRVVNNRYRQERELRSRIEEILSAHIPKEIARVKVVIEAQGVVSHSYTFHTIYLHSYRENKISRHALDILCPMKEAESWRGEYEAALLFNRKREAWTFTLHPRLLTFFGSAKGKFKYSIGTVAAASGYLPGAVIYQLQAAYDIFSSMHGLSGSDRLNPSHLLQVRSDSMRYFRARTLSLEQAYLQRSWNVGKGFFWRAAAGYFEPAYAGIAAEWLCYPVGSDLSLGFEGACVLKRHYKDLGFFHKIRKRTKHHREKKVPFVGLQGFFHLHYDFTPLALNFDVTIGQFLARDRGIKIEATRIFSNGVCFSLWTTFTNGKDVINGHRYFDKGFAFSIPLDIFLRQSSRTYLGYAMSAWLRDVGATAETGRRLYPTLYEERAFPPQL